MQKKKETFYNRSLERALQILNCFGFERQSYTLNGLSEKLSLPGATVLRLCSTLIKYRFLKQDAESKQYSLGLGLFDLGSIVFSSFSLRKAASRHLAELQSKLNVTLFLGIIDNGELLYVDKLDDPMNPITFTSKIGTRRPPYWGMVARAILAFMPEAEVRKILQGHTLKPTARKSLTKKEDFFKTLRTEFRKGYAFDDETTFDGISGVAAPVFDLAGKVAGAVGAAFITSSVDNAARDNIVNETVLAAEKISIDMGYSGSSRRLS